MHPFRLFGIRHHGPGSARRLLHALQEWEPDVVLIELPADVEKELMYARDPDLKPPVALVSYDDKNLDQASYYPFAHFSPEWQALRWALEREVPVRAMDLPNRFMLAQEKQQSTQLRLVMPDDPIPEKLLADPLGYVAELAGASDGEHWWETTFEKEQTDTDVFASILELMSALRKELAGRERPINLRREAYMRQVMRNTQKEGYSRIAVICGAWHAPVLANLPQYKAGQDAKLLRGLPKIKIKTTWIPWSYERLSRADGYGAGVHSPAWYAMLFDAAGEAAAHWMVSAARLLREEGMNASPAHAQEAVRLARNLAAMREQSLPGLAELKEAALATLAAGKPERMALIEQRLIMGKAVGEVPLDIPAVPLQADLMKRLKSARLLKYWGETGKQYVKANKTNPRGGIDLREATDLEKSYILHQLNLLDLSWGVLKSDSDYALGSFREIWQLHWQPELNLQLLEAARYGPNLREASAARIGEKAAKLQDLSALTQLTLDTLRSGLAELVPALSQQLHELSALTEDASYLLSALPTLVSIIRYGDSRKTDTTALALLVHEMTPRLTIGLPASLTGIDAEQATQYLQDLMAAQRAYGNLAIPELSEQWQAALLRISRNAAVHPMLQGGATRLAMDANLINEERAIQLFHYALSAANGPTAIAHYLEGFLSGSGLLLLYHPVLLRLIDDWVLALGPDAFQTVLPLLRRTFARFSGPERKKLLAHLQHMEQAETALVEEIKEDVVVVEPQELQRAKSILPTLKSWLGT